MRLIAEVLGGQLGATARKPWGKARSGVRGRSKVQLDQTNVSKLARVRWSIPIRGSGRLEIPIAVKGT
jgi:hypothetical protein